MYYNSCMGWNACLQLLDHLLCITTHAWAGMLVYNYLTTWCVLQLTHGLECLFTTTWPLGVYYNSRMGRNACLQLLDHLVCITIHAWAGMLVYNYLTTWCVLQQHMGRNACLQLLDHLVCITTTHGPECLFTTT